LLLEAFTFSCRIDAIWVIVDYGYLFLQDYSVACQTGNWSHKEKTEAVYKECMSVAHQ